MEFRYRDIVLGQLARYGIKPGSDTPPELIREFVNDLYVIEIRELRNRVRRGLIAKQALAARVKELRKRYLLLSVPLRHWTE